MLKTSRLILRPIVEGDLTSRYISWLNDPAVNRYLETRFELQTKETVREYWRQHNSDPSSPWFAICINSTFEHIGNIKLGPINWNHHRADISLFIGEQTYWGQGYAQEAIARISEWAYNELGLEKLNAGMYTENQGSINAFKRCGFRHEGTLISECISDGTRQDVVRLGLTKLDWQSGRQF